MIRLGSLKLKAQLFCGEDIAMGPGKADLLEAIAARGSISAAGRVLGMSYRRSWLLVDEMNRCWREPLVEAAAGGARGGGARVTRLGAEVLGHYRDLERQMSQATDGAAMKALTAAIRAAPKPSQHD